MRPLVLACAVAALATPTSAQDAPRDVVVAMMLAQGCTMTEDEAEAAFGDRADADALGEAIEAMMEEGIVVPDEASGSARLVSDECEDAPEAADDPARAALVAAFEGNGCRLGRGDYGAAVADSDLRPDEWTAAVMAMIGEGAVVFEDRDTAVLRRGGACEGAQARTVAAEPGMVSTLSELAAERGCTLGDDDLVGLWLDRNLDRDGIDLALVQLLSEGKARPTPEGGYALRGIEGCPE